jgi:hypothetical protein
MREKADAKIVPGVARLTQPFGRVRKEASHKAINSLFNEYAQHTAELCAPVREIRDSIDLKRPVNKNFITMLMKKIDKCIGVSRTRSR